MPAPQWYFSGGGKWTPLSPEDCEALEAAMKNSKMAAAFGSRGGAAMASAMQVTLGPQKATYMVDFTKMEQKNPQTGKTRALKRGEDDSRAEPRVSVSETPAAAPSDGGAQPWKVGEAVECYSLSAGQWCAGEVTQVKKENLVTVQYIVPNGQQVMKQLPLDHPHLRRAGAAAAASAEAAFADPVARPGPAPEKSHFKMPVQVGAGGYPEAGAPVARGFPKEAAAPSLDDVPFLGDRLLQDIQADTLRRLQRLLRHGDLRGAERTMQRAKMLNIEDLAKETAQLEALRGEGEFALLLPRSAGA